MVPLKYQAVVYACVAIILFAIWITIGIDGLIKSADFAVLFARNFLTDFYIAFTAFSIYKAKRLHFKLAQGWCIKKDADVLIASTTFVFIVIYRYHLSLSSILS